MYSYQYGLPHTYIQSLTSMYSMLYLWHKLFAACET